MNNIIFNKNISLLKKNKYNFRAVKKLMHYSSDNKYKLKQTKNNMFAVLYNDKPLTSIYNPIEEAKRLIQQFIKDNNEHIGIFLSIASFFHIEYFLSLNENNKAVIIEKDIEIVKLIFENFNTDKENIFEKIIIILDEDIKTILDFFNFYMNDNDAKKIIYIRHIRASNINDKSSRYYDEINIYLANSIREKLMSLTSNYYFAPIWARNILYNMHFNIGYSIKTFHNILKKEIPVLLVSAGASADKYIEKIKELSKTHFIIVLSHAFNTLIKNNIKPNAVVTTDGGFYSSIHLKELIKKENNDINIFTSHTAYPFPLTHIENERIFYFSHDESFENILYPIDDNDNDNNNDSNNNNILFYMEGSVIMPALRIAYMLNPKYILLAGCDFCHLDDKTHSKYSNASFYDFINSNKLKTFESAKYKRLNDIQKIKCYDNIYRNTSSSLLSYKNHFEDIIQEISNMTDIFNLTKESAEIKNVKQYDNNIIFENIEDFNINKLVKKNIKEYINKEQLIEKINNFLYDINNTENINDSIKKLAYIISPWHIERLEKSAISYEEFKSYINKWYDDIKPLLSK
ncbi:6-hydroxymethylpterin diphosphokinase MptE-like protein [uncultured Brachyspira sp.]|uniref:motility associated factor glycosyltransferase family protein n=1 Tax=uncultured Brachyspira sp. TaxID=221953 RepID=UPI0025E1D676|nr:6-hydroxymethylpterin diphosphokinase MptE-like protein [uncultured Brachyspira sp.]